MLPPVTWFCWTVVVVVGGVLLWMGVAFTPLDYLTHPARSVHRIGERDLDFLAVEAALPAGERAVYRLLGMSTDGGHEEIARAYGRVIRFLDLDLGLETDENVEALRAALVVLLAEFGAWEDVEEAMNRMDTSPASVAFRRSVQHVYGDEAPGRAVDESAFALVRAGRNSPNWSLDRLYQRWAEREGRSADADGRVRATLDRGHRLLLRVRILFALELAVLIAGLGWALSRWRSWHRPFPVSDGATVARWSFGYGMNVLVRCLVAGLIAQVVLYYFFPPILHESATLLSGIPLLLVAHHYFVRSDGTTLPATFGLGPGRMHWRRMLLFCLALTAVDQAGCMIIHLGATWAGLEPQWEDGLPESLLFGTWPYAVFSTLDGVLWAPVFEEVFFRGLLYLTLRTRYRPVPAALMSGALFGAVHLYSLAGFLEVAWTGMILAIGYERCRSLWPCIFAHAFNNLIYCLGMVLIYR